MGDSTSAISVAKNPVLYSRTKHIEVRYHFLRDNVEKGNIDLIHVSTEKQLADIQINLWTMLHLHYYRVSLVWFFLLSFSWRDLMYIFMLHFHLCIISC
jgi:hypothetical protein